MYQNLTKIKELFGYFKNPQYQNQTWYNCHKLSNNKILYEYCPSFGIEAAWNYLIHSYKLSEMKSIGASKYSICQCSKQGKHIRFKWITYLMTDLDNSQHLYLSEHKLQEYPIVLTSSLSSHKTLVSYQCESRQDLKYVCTRKRII